MTLIKKCQDCKKYTMKNNCQICGKETLNPFYRFEKIRDAPKRK